MATVFGAAALATGAFACTQETRDRYAQAGEETGEALESTGRDIGEGTQALGNELEEVFTDGDEDVEDVNDSAEADQERRAAVDAPAVDVDVDRR